MNELVPSAPHDIDDGVAKTVLNLENAAKGRAIGVEMSKLVGFDREGMPDYPKVTLRVEMGAYGNPVASIKVQQTATNHNDWPGSLKDLDVRSAYEYYMRLDSAEAVDAIEKVVRAPAPRAWAFITLLDRMKLVREEIERQ